MIKPGRPPSGYSDYENVFYLLRKELEQIQDILIGNIAEVNQNFLTERQISESTIEEYNKKYEELKQEYLPCSEEPIVAHDNALGNALPILGTYEDLFFENLENKEIIHIATIDQLIKAVIVMTYSTVEFNLNSICKILEKRLNSRIQLAHLKKTHGYIGTYITFIEKVAEIDYDRAAFFQFQKFQKIRNNIVHSNSEPISTEIKQIINSYKKSTVIKNERYYFTKEFVVKKFIRVSITLLNSIEKGIDLKFKKK